MNIKLDNLTPYRDYGLLILRIGLGLMFVYHGAPKLFAGAETWAKLGGAMGFLGITFAPAFWGFLAAVAEFFGGILLILGFLTRPACIFLAFTMLVAVVMKLATGAGLMGASQALEDGIVFLSLILVGPGKYSLDESFFKTRTA